jgi:MFS family permease
MQIAVFHDQRNLLMCLILAAFMLVALVLTCIAIKERPLKTRPEATVRSTIIGSFALDVRRHRDFFWLSVSRAVTNVGFYTFLVIILYFLEYTLRVPDAEGKSRLVLLPAIAAATLSSLPSGLLSDRIGRRKLVFVAQFLMAGGALLFAFAPNVNYAVLAAIPAGLAYGVFTAVEWAFACNLLPSDEAARYLGIWNASAVVPQIMAFPLAGLIGSAVSGHVPGLGWRVDFAFAAVCCLVGAYFLTHVRERLPAPTG